MAFLKIRHQALRCEGSPERDFSFYCFFCLSSSLQLHTDLDVGNRNIKYVLAGEGAGTIFAINELTGDIHAMKRLDREEKAEYTLTAQVINADTDQPLEPPSEFIIKVQDINDNPPQFTEGPYRVSVPEMSPVGESTHTHTHGSVHKQLPRHV